MTGANPSAEEAEEALEAGAEQVNNVVHSFRLVSTQFDKKVSVHCTCRDTEGQGNRRDAYHPRPTQDAHIHGSMTDTQSYLTYLKGYMKAVKAKLETTNPDRVAAFEKAAAGFAKKVIGNFKDYEFYTGESMDTEGMVALLNYREDGITPYRESQLRTSNPASLDLADISYLLEGRPP